VVAEEDELVSPEVTRLWELELLVPLELVVPCVALVEDVAAVLLPESKAPETARPPATESEVTTAPATRPVRTWELRRIALSRCVESL
jgi:hypothetical protein